MELAAVPRRRASSSFWVVLASVVLLPVTLLALVPTAFGLERYVIADDTGVAGVGRGTVALERTVPVGDLARGDVVTFSGSDPALAAASAPEPDLVTAQVERVDDGLVTTRGPDGVRDLTGATTVSQVVVAVPLVGYPFLVLGSGLWALGSLLAGLLLGAAVVTGAGRRGLVARPVPGWAGSAPRTAARR